MTFTCFKCKKDLDEDIAKSLSDGKRICNSCMEKFTKKLQFNYNLNNMNFNCFLCRHLKNEIMRPVCDKKNCLLHRRLICKDCWFSYFLFPESSSYHLRNTNICHSCIKNEANRIVVELNPG